MNKIILIGNLTKDPELLQTNAGKNFTKFTLAVARQFKNENGDKETDFLNCVAWDKKAEIITQYAKKGNKLAIIGNVRTGSYENKQGQKVYTTDIFVDEIELLGGKQNDSKEEKPVMTEIDEDLPF